MPSATIDRPGTRIPPSPLVDGWASGYLTTADPERRLLDAAARCIGRWGIRKTSLDDVAREARVSRATVYRMFPGGKERVVQAVFLHEAGRFLHGLDADLNATETLEDLLVVGLGAALGLAADHPVLGTVVAHEPELVLPHFAFRRLDRVLALADALCRPHLSRFLPPGAIGPAAELLARIVLTFGFRPAAWLDRRDAASMRRFVRTYVLPALGPATDPPIQEHP
ncbi:MAG TPA: TetR/AcrR family transcriptional regulator [Acidimicrobiales bacterium]